MKEITPKEEAALTAGQIPTEEEQESEEKKVVYIRNKKETIGWAIPAGGFFMAVTRGEEIEVRCLSGSTKAVVNVLPG